MTIQEAIHKIFTENPERWFSGKKLRTELRKITIMPIEHEFNRDFLAFRDTFEWSGKRVLKFKEFGCYYYCLSNNKHLIQKHNLLLSRDQQRKEKRKVLINNS